MQYGHRGKRFDIISDMLDIISDLAGYQRRVFSRLSHPLLSPDVVSITKAAAITARIDITVTGTKYKRILVLIFCLGFLFFFTGTLLHNLYKFFTSIAQ